MSLTAVIVIVVLVLLGAYAVSLYNGLVRLKHGVSKAWSNIDVLLKQRHDELPKLVETCKQYMQHERTTLERVIAARSAVASALARAERFGVIAFVEASKARQRRALPPEASVDLCAHPCSDRWSVRAFIHSRCGPALDKAVDNRVGVPCEGRCEGVVKKWPACPPPAQAG